MKTRTRTKLVHEADYIAAVEVELQYDETGWAPYVSVADTEKLDHVREALQKKDLVVRNAARSLCDIPDVVPGLSKHAHDVSVDVLIGNTFHLSRVSIG